MEEVHEETLEGDEYIHYLDCTDAFTKLRLCGRGIGMGNTCKSMADSCQCMTKTITIL